MPAKAIPPYRPALLERLAAWWAARTDRSTGWFRLPRYTGAVALAGLRITLRRKNLHDTSQLPTRSQARHQRVFPQPGHYLTSRTADGSFNDLRAPSMGRVGTRFGRNVPVEQTLPGPNHLVLTPNPRTVSLRLLTREQFIPATTLNMLAAAWLQFMVHDWLSHGENQMEDPWRIPLDEDDDWPTPPMEIRRTRRDTTRPAHEDGQPPTFLNYVTHWWDASQIYGSDRRTQRMVRSGEGGRLRIEPNGLLPVDPTTGIEKTGMSGIKIGLSGNWWLGLDLMHTLFAREHNAICDHLHAAYPAWSDQELFDRARLVNAALLAKIHTIEWTPAILGTPTLETGMRANWFGVAGERIHKVAGRLSPSEWISGIPGSDTNHFGVPYSMTEEFVAVYRMHPLIRDDYPFRSVHDDRPLETRLFPDLAFRQTRPALEAVGMGNALYSFGLMHPGAITLHNFPRSMQRLAQLDGTLLDLAAVDILRNRERGVPRYNEFRRLMHRPPVTRFEELSDKPEWVEQIREVYEGDLERVDLMVGLYAEPLPPGFGFSDTAFRIFILMASRRLNSDRFFTTDFTPEVYSPAGMAWLDENSFATVLIRHFPELRPALRNGRSPFAPWAPIKR